MVITLWEVCRLGLVRGRLSSWGNLGMCSAGLIVKPQTLSEPSSVVAEIQWKMGSFGSLSARWLTTAPVHVSQAHSELLHLEHETACSLERRAHQIPEFEGPSNSGNLFSEKIAKTDAFGKPRIWDLQSLRFHSLSDARGISLQSDDELRTLGFDSFGRDDISIMRTAGGRFCVTRSDAQVFLEQKVLNGKKDGKSPRVQNSKQASRVTMETEKQNLKKSRVQGRSMSSNGSGCTAKSEVEGLHQTQEPNRVTNVYTFNRLISVLMEKGYCGEAYSVYEHILRTGCKPDSYTYISLIKGFCDAGELAEAWKFFKGIFVQECVVPAVVYNAMVHGLGSAGFVDEALKLVTEMTEKGCLPDVCTYNSVVHSLGKAGKLDDALIVFESMPGKGCPPDVITYNSLIRSLGKADRLLEACELYEKMITRGCLPDVYTFNTLLQILGKAGEITQATRLYSFMKTVGCRPDVYTYSSLITGLCWAGRVDDALLFSIEMTERECAPNTVTFNSWIDGLCKESRVVEAYFLFRKMSLLGYVPDVITYSILIDALCKTGQFVDKSFSLLKDLLKSNHTIDRRTSDIIFHSFKKIGMLKQAKRIARNFRAKKSPGLTSSVEA